MASKSTYDALEESDSARVDYGALPEQPSEAPASNNPPESKSNFDRSEIEKHAISWFDVAVICGVSTINQLYVNLLASLLISSLFSFPSLNVSESSNVQNDTEFRIFKSWFVFSRFITEEYHISFFELSLSLAVIQIAIVPSLLVIPSLNSFQCHYLCFFLQLIPMGCVIAQSLLSGSVFNIYILSTIRTFIGQLCWTLMNSICFHFMLEPGDGTKPWRKNTATTLFMGTWTYSTFLFLAVGPVIDVYGFREAMLVAGGVNAVGAFILLIRMPRISIHAFIEMEKAAANADGQEIDEAEFEEETGCNAEAVSNLMIICRDLVAMLIMFNTMTAVCNWGCYYGSFGPWLTDLFNLNAQELGQYATICEAMAEMISLGLIPIISKHVSNSTLCVLGGMCETTSVVLLNVVLWNGEDILNNTILELDKEWMQIGCILFIIFMFYAGHETLYIALMVSLEFIPSKQYSTAVAMFSVFDYMGGFVGQSFVTYVFEHRGISAMAPIMLCVEAVSISCLIAVGVIQRWRRRKKKKIPKPKQSIASKSIASRARDESLLSANESNGINGVNGINGLKRDHSRDKQRSRLRSDSESYSSDDRSALDGSMVSGIQRIDSRYGLLSEDDNVS